MSSIPKASDQDATWHASVERCADRDYRGTAFLLANAYIGRDHRVYRLPEANGVQRFSSWRQDERNLGMAAYRRALGFRSRLLSDRSLRTELVKIGQGFGRPSQNNKGLG